MIPQLVGAELGRLRSRRSFWVFALVALALLAAFQIAVNAEVRPTSAAEIAQSRTDYQQATQQYQDQVKECTAGGGSTAACDFGAPTPDEFVRTPSTFAEIAPSSLTIGAAMSWLVAYLIGSASSGGEFSTGSIGNWLTFIPRRGAVFASKLIALALGCAVFSAIMAAVAIAVPALLVQLHHGAAVDHLASLIATGGRGVGITVALAAVGFCFGLLFRHTVAAVGIALGYFLIVFVRSAILGSVAWAVRLTPWTPEANLLAVAQKGYHYQSAMDGSSYGNADATEPVIHTVSLEHGLLYLGVGLVVLLALTLFVFRRRDVG